MGSILLRMLCIRVRAGSPLWLKVSYLVRRAEREREREQSQAGAKAEN
jgi:hypothetical protein